MKKTSEIQTSFLVPIYDFKIKLVVTTQIEKWACDNPLQTGITPAEACEALCIPGDKTITIVLKPKSPQSHLAHEIGHAARFIMNYIGFKITAENDEPLAYLEDHLHQEIHKRLHRLRLKSGRNYAN